MVQWLRLHIPTAEDTGSTPGQGTKIPHALQHNQKTKKYTGTHVIAKIQSLVIRQQRRNELLKNICENTPLLFPHMVFDLRSSSSFGVKQIKKKKLWRNWDNFSLVEHNTHSLSDCPYKNPPLTQ